MALKRQRARAGEFIVTEEPGAIARDAGWLAEGQNLEAGTLLAADGADLVAWESGACAGILFAGCNATAARQRVTVVARLATVNFELLSYGTAEEADARDALEAIRLTVLSDHLIADTGGGGGVDYVQKLYHFDGTAWLTNSALASTDSRYFAYSFWLQFDSFTNGPALFVVSPSDYKTFSGASFSGLDNRMNAQFSNNSNSSRLIWFVEGDPDISLLLQPNVLYHFLYAMDAGADAGQKIFKLYINDANYNLYDFGRSSDQDGSFEVISNGLPFVFGGDTFDGDGFIGNVGDPWFGPGVNLLDESGDIPEATRRKFISALGGPVDPISNYPSGAVLLTGTDLETGHNSGNGGDFIVTGAPVLVT